MSKRNWTNDEIIEYRKVHKSPFYYNKEDSNFVVNKRLGVGITVNFANPFSSIFIFLLIIMPIILTTLKNI